MVLLEVRQILVLVLPKSSNHIGVVDDIQDSLSILL
jgi:hypothetical protein